MPEMRRCTSYKKVFGYWGQRDYESRKLSHYYFEGVSRITYVPLSLNCWVETECCLTLNQLPCRKQTGYGWSAERIVRTENRKFSAFLCGLWSPITSRGERQGSRRLVCQL